MGKEIVERLTHAGATVLTTARSTPPDLQTPDRLLQADVSTAEGAAQIVQETPARLGGVGRPGQRRRWFVLPAWRSAGAQ